MKYLSKWRDGLREMSEAAGFKNVRWDVLTSIAFYKIKVTDVDLQGECFLFFLRRWDYIVRNYHPRLGKPDEYFYRCFYNASRLVVTRGSLASKAPKAGYGEMPLNVSSSDGLDDILVRFASYLEGMGYLECLSMFKHLLSGGTLYNYSDCIPSRRLIYRRLQELAQNWTY